MSLRLRGPLAFWLLRTLTQPYARLVARNRREKPPAIVPDPAKLELYFGKNIWERFAGKTVLDYGSGAGLDAVCCAQRGARTVYGLEIREWPLEIARDVAARHGVADHCVFVNIEKDPDALRALEGKLDWVYSVDCFEHYARPDEVLREMHELLAPGGRCLVSFGPPWNHPYGGHMRFFNWIPWMHLLFAEETIMAVRSLYKTDGAQRIEEVEGGLNRMTVGRFIELTRGSGFRIEQLRPVPIWRLTWLVLHPRLREYFTSVVHCEMVKPA